MRSIKVFLFAVLLALICLGNFVAALNGYRASLQRAELLLDQQLAEQASLLGRLLLKYSAVDDDMLPANSLFQIWKADKPLFFSRNAPQKPLIDNAIGYHFASYDGYRWRLLVVEPQFGFRILVAQRYDIYAQLIEDILLESIIPILWIIPVLALLIWLIINSGLGPLNQLALLLFARKTTDFSAIDEAEYPKELAVVVGSINKLMIRLSEAFGRESRFSSDAAHELRTPLTGLKLSLHNLRADLHHEGTMSHDETLASMQESADKMSHTIEQLLALYRLTPQTFLQGLSDCNVTEIVQEQVIDCYDNLNKKGQTISLVGEASVIQGDSFGLSILFRNLIDNASKYSPAGGEIRISLSDEVRQNRPNESDVMVVIEDEGTGIPEADYGRVFDRFYRQGGDRHTSKVPGSGLGLSIVQHVVKLHEGRIQLDRSKALGGLSVCVRLPVKQDESLND